ncbi:MAG: hypothetical protein NUV57_01345 [archaeon]|nr:hypothetical protein [archaeon]
MSDNFKIINFKELPSNLQEEAIQGVATINSVGYEDLHDSRVIQWAKILGNPANVVLCMVKGGNLLGVIALSARNKIKLFNIEALWSKKDESKALFREKKFTVGTALYLEAEKIAIAREFDIYRGAPNEHGEKFFKRLDADHNPHFKPIRRR